MNLQDCIKFAKEHKFCFMATDQKDQPRLRIVGLWYADETGFYFQCGTYKPFYKQLRENNKVEVCFLNDEAIHNAGAGMKIMRVAGKIEFLEDREIRARCIKDLPWIMNRLGVTQPENAPFAVFRIYTGEAYFWTRDCVEKESELEKVKF